MVLGGVHKHIVRNLDDSGGVDEDVVGIE